jgi:putative two-component system response regulator
MMAVTAKASVLIVDDAPESIDVLRGVLGADYRVKGAESAPPDLILLDVMMPDMDGYEVCRRLKANPSTAPIPVIFVTTLSDTESETRGLELGAVDYVCKPFVPSLVRSRVRTHVALRRQSISLEALVSARTAELVETRLQIIQRLGRAAEYRDNETGMHVLRMSHIARLLALQLGMGEEFAELILQAAPMHDIGKIGIPDRVLLKPGKLDAEEWEIMKRHTTIGAEIIGDHPSELLRTAHTVALSHHERWDGSGYPHGLAADAIPEVARVVAVADVFDALLSNRPYKRAWSTEDTVSHVKSESGRHFDPRAANALLEVLPACLEVRRRYSDD